MDERTFCVIDVESCQFFEDTLDDDICIEDILDSLSKELKKTKENLFMLDSKGTLCEDQRQVSSYFKKPTAKFLLFDRISPSYSFPEISKNWEDFEDFPEMAIDWDNFKIIQIKDLDPKVEQNLNNLYELSLKAKIFYAKYFTYYRYFKLSFDALDSKLKAVKALLRSIEAYFEELNAKWNELNKKVKNIKFKVTASVDSLHLKLGNLKENSLKQFFSYNFLIKMQEKCVKVLIKLEKILKNVKIKHLDKFDQELFEQQDSFMKLKSGFKAIEGTIKKEKLMNESTEGLFFNHLEVCTEFKLFSDDLLAWNISKTPSVLNYWNSLNKQTKFEQLNNESCKLEKIIRKIEALGSSLDQKKETILAYFAKYVKFVFDKMSYLKLTVKKKIEKILNAVKRVKNSYKFLIKPEFFIEHQNYIMSYLQKAEVCQYNGVIFTLFKGILAESEQKKEFVKEYGKFLPSLFFPEYIKQDNISPLENALLELKGPFSNELNFSCISEEQIHSFYSDQTAQLVSKYDTEVLQLENSISSLSDLIKTLLSSIENTKILQKNNKITLINLHQELEILKNDENLLLNCSLLQRNYQEYVTKNMSKLNNFF